MFPFFLVFEWYANPKCQKFDMVFVLLEVLVRMTQCFEITSKSLIWQKIVKSTDFKIFTKLTKFTLFHEIHNIHLVHEIGQIQ